MWLLRLVCWAALGTGGADGVGRGFAVELHVGSCELCAHRHLHSARDAVREFRDRQRRDGLRTAGAVRVTLHEGTYPPLELDPALDSGLPDSPTEYVGHNLDGESPPVVSAGVEVPKDLWKPTTANPGVVLADLKAVGFTAHDLGRLPDNGNARGEAAWIEPYNSVWWGTICEQRNASNQKAMLFHQGAVGSVGTHLSRYPNIDQKTGRWSWLHGVGPTTTRRPDSSGKSGAVGLEINANDSARVLGWVQNEEAPYLHGYWVADWEDTVARIDKGNESLDHPAVYWAAGADGPQPGHSPRYIGFNLLSELDAKNEYFISAAGAVHFLPKVPMSEWLESPVVSMNATAVLMDGVQHVVLSGMRVAYSKSTGISALNVTGVTISNCTVHSHGGFGIDMRGAAEAQILNSTVFDTGCTGVQAHCGEMSTMTSGNCVISGNTVTQMGQYKRTYQPGIHWAGVDNNYTLNVVHNGPHACISGGGNDAPTDVGGVGNLFEGNTLEDCGYETSDIGAFYTCGQQATAWVNPGNILRQNTFRNIRNTGSHGVQPIWVNAVYLDDQVAGWQIEGNRFYNVSRGVYLNGGRLTTVAHNYFENCDTAILMGNPAEGRHKGVPVPTLGQIWNCSAPTRPHPGYPAGNPVCLPRNGDCGCNRLGLEYELDGPASQVWKTRYPALVASLSDPACSNQTKKFVPCYSKISDNAYCNTSSFIGKNLPLALWAMTVENNTMSCTPQ